MTCAKDTGKKTQGRRFTIQGTRYKTQDKSIKRKQDTSKKKKYGTI